MAFSTSMDAKNERCATCQYWHGEREVKFISCAPTRVLYNGGNEECSAWHQKHSAGFSCNRYKRWVELP